MAMLKDYGWGLCFHCHFGRIWNCYRNKILCVLCEGFPKGQTEMRRFTLNVGSTVSGWDPGVKVRGVSSFMDLGFLTVGAI